MLQRTNISNYGKSGSSPFRGYSGLSEASGDGIDLGNVLTTFTDRKYESQSTDTYSAYIKSSQDYYPFGMQMANRGFNANLGEYRFAFNGKESDKEVYGEKNSYDFGARIYDPLTGRWLSMDPLDNKYPSISPYTFVLNSPINSYDPDGRWVVVVTGETQLYIAFMGLSVYAGFAIGSDGVGALAGHGESLGLGFEASLGVNVTIYPTMPSLDYLKDEGSSVNFAGAYGGKVGAGISKSSGYYGINFSYGGGFGVHAGYTKSDTRLKRISWDDMKNYFKGNNVNGLDNSISIDIRQKLKSFLIKTLDIRWTTINNQIKSNYKQILKNNKLIDNYRVAKGTEKSKLKKSYEAAIESNKDLVEENKNAIKEREEITNIKKKLE